MRKGSFFISMTKRLPSSDFEVLEYEMYRMSWGEATVFIMQKVTESTDEADEESDLEHDHDHDDNRQRGGGGAGRGGAGEGKHGSDDEEEDEG
jgi:hypothetical protein